MTPQMRKKMNYTICSDLLAAEKKVSLSRMILQTFMINAQLLNTLIYVMKGYIRIQNSAKWFTVKTPLK